MTLKGSTRLETLGSYAFAAIDEKVRALAAEGLQPVDFGVGDPIDPTPECVRRATAEGIETYRSAGYPPYAGSRKYLDTIADWFQKRFGVKLDSEREICASIGSKESIFHFAEAIVNPGDRVIVPEPGYPPYGRGTIFAEGVPYPVPLTAEHRFLPDLAAIPDDVARRARVFWLTHPNSPAGTVAPPEYLRDWIAFCRRWGIVAASDEAYSEIYFTDEPPHSALEYGREGVVVFQSLSKRSAMTGYRVGWVCGDENLIALFKKVKTNIDSGVPWFIQAGAIAALRDEEHVREARERYRARRDVLVDAFERAGCPRSEPEATIYIWQRAPEGWSALDLAERLLDPAIGAVTLPAPALMSDEVPRLPYVRLALVPSIDDCRRVGEAIAGRLRQRGP